MIGADQEDQPRLEVEAVPGAAEDLVEAGRSYWHYSVNDYGAIVWTKSAKASTNEVASGTPYQVAALGVRAFVPGCSCQNCGAPLALRTRDHWATLRSTGLLPKDCVACNDVLLTYLAGQGSPEAQAARLDLKAAREQALARRLAEQQAHQAWQVARAALIQERWRRHFHGLDDDGSPPMDLVNTVTKHPRAAIAALAAVEYAAQVTPIPAHPAWAIPAAANAELTRSYLAAAWRAGLLAPDPDSDPRAWCWTVKDWGTALAAAEDTVPPVGEIESSIYLEHTSWYVPWATSRGTGAELLVQTVRDHLSPEVLSADVAEEVHDLARELLVAESIRYLNYQLELHNLPTVPEKHRSRLEEVLGSFVEEHTLGQAYALVWRAARDAAAAHQRTPRAPADRMSAHAVNRLEDMARDALQSMGKKEIPSYNMVEALPLSAITRTLFHSILNRAPERTSVLDVRQALPGTEITQGTQMPWSPQDPHVEGHPVTVFLRKIADAEPFAVLDDVDILPHRCRKVASQLEGTEDGGRLGDQLRDLAFTYEMARTVLAPRFALLAAVTATRHQDEDSRAAVFAMVEQVIELLSDNS